MKIVTKTFSCLLLLIICFTSCKKDKQEVPYGEVDNPNNPPPATNYLQLVLNDYLPVAKIDSVMAIWEVYGTAQAVKMQFVNNQFQLALNQLRNAGSGTITLQLYTQEKVDNKPLQWERRFAYTYGQTRSIEVSAPVGVNDPAWNPRAIFHYDNSMGSRFSAIIALRPEDPYFELKGVAPIYAKRIEVVRSFHQKESGTLVFSRGWVGQPTHLDAKGNLTDRQHFLNLREQLDDKEWNQYRIRASFFLNSTPNMTYEFHLVQNR